MTTDEESAPAGAPATETMFEIVCSVDHTPYGAPAGRVLARVRELRDTLERYSQTHPRCVLTAVEVQAPVGSQHGELPEAEVEPSHRGVGVRFEQPVRQEQPVYPRGRT
jgi:hypothetical protein